MALRSGRAHAFGRRSGAGHFACCGRGHLAWRARDADHVAYGVGEVPDGEFPRRRLGAHQARPAEALGRAERGLDVGNADVEQDPAGTAGAAADPAVDAGPADERAPVNETVRAGLRDLLADRVSYLEFPAEQRRE